MKASRRRVASPSSPTIRSWYARSSLTRARSARRLAASRSASALSPSAWVLSTDISPRRASNLFFRSARPSEVTRYS